MVPTKLIRLVIALVLTLSCTLCLAKENEATGEKLREIQQNEENEENDRRLIKQRRIKLPFEESLDVTLLPKHKVLTSFFFELSSDAVNISSSHKFTHYKSFPRSLAPILEHSNARELHLRFGQGWWDSEEWGQLPNSGQTSGGVGVEIWAVIEAKDKESCSKQWTSLVNSLSGLFCASLNFIDSAKTVYPIDTFSAKESSKVLDENNQLFLLRAALPSEPVCTENLTPFLKFLPTRGKAGLSSLLDGHKVYESLWHMMSIDIEMDFEDDSYKYIMKQKIQAVSDIKNALLKKVNPIPKPLSGDRLKCDLSKPYDSFQCFPIEDMEDITFTLSDIFGRSISGPNFVSAHPSSIRAHATRDWNVYLRVGENHYGTGTNSFELLEPVDYDLYFSSTKGLNVPKIKNAPIYVSRSLTGYAQDKGDSRTVFRNPSDKIVKLFYLESLPWFMRIYLHTLEITGGAKDEIVQSIRYVPEVDRQRPTHIEFELVIPPNSTVALSYSFDKSLLLYAEYPPDANHGFSVEPGVVKVIEPVTYHLRTSPALLTLPTPDFSMPYNVIILTSTVMSLSFGTIFNLLAKRIVTEEEAELLGNVGIFGTIIQIKQQIKSRIQFLRKVIISKIKGFKKGNVKEKEKLTEEKK